MNQRISFVIVGIWFAIALILPMLHDGLSVDSITRLLVLGYFLASLLWFFKKGKTVKVKNHKTFFILWCSANAMVIEIFHMISKPLAQSLLVTSGMPFISILKNTSIDLVLTLPAYLAIFSVIWYFTNRYKYSPFSFFFIFGLAQALGDGSGFLLLNPVFLIFIPYVMVNYWAMNFIPYLLVEKHLPKASQSDKLFPKIILPLIFVPLTYVVSGVIITTLGKALGWI